ncbi:MAG: hypothetical protein Q9166_005393 [cf. Caloplaca sp. 2 TL-2023]
MLVHALSTFLPLLLTLPLTTFASPTPQQQQDSSSSNETLTQEEGEAQLRADWEAQEQAMSYYDSVPVETPSPQELAEALAEESALLKYYATASFEEIPYPTPTGGFVDLDTYPTGAVDYYLPKPTDPCGPARQDGTEFNTCTVNPDGTPNYEGSPFVYFSDEPAPYGVQCLPMPARAGEGQGTSNAPTRTVAQLNIDACNPKPFCESIPNAPRDQWVWNTWNETQGCAMAMWLPAGEGVAPLPDETRCELGIFKTMGLYCEEGGPTNQIAAVNVRRLPGNGTTGEQANSGYPSYIIAPEALTVS